MGREIPADEVIKGIRSQIVGKGLNHAQIARELDLPHFAVQETVHLKFINPKVVDYLRSKGVDFPEIKRVKRIAVIS